MAPVHTDEVNRSVDAVGDEKLAGVSQESGERGLTHLTGGHDKILVLDRAKTRGVAGNWHIVGRIGKDHRRPLVVHQARVGRGFQRTAAVEPMISEQPKIADITYRV